MEFLSVKQFSEKWGLTEQQVRSYCRDHRIPGAFSNKGIWYIPLNAKKPNRKKRNDIQENPLPPLARKILRQMKRKSYHGLYDYIQINLGYSSCRMASVRLTRNQVETIFRKGKVNVSFEPLKVSDLVEILNHFICIEYLFKRINEPLTSRIIQETHYRLMFGTVDQRKHKVTPGEYRTPSVTRKGRDLVPAEEIKDRMKILVESYESLKVVERRDILDFHVRFERLCPFEDGNGRIGRMIMFKECLRHGVIPFIIDDKHRRQYLDGICEWDKDHSILTEVVLDAQERFHAQIELQSLMEHGQNFLPENYCAYEEETDDED